MPVRVALRRIDGGSRSVVSGRMRPPHRLGVRAAAARVRMEGVDQRAVLLAPDHVPDEIGGSYCDACAVLNLDPRPGGYAVYLADVMNSRCTIISADTRPLREAADGAPACGGRWVTDLGTIIDVVRSASLVDVILGWPDEFGGGPRCNFCREADPDWVYDGADVAVVFDTPVAAGLPLPVLAAEVTGCIDRFACTACRALIDAADQRSWHRLLARYGEREVPAAVQAAWREFWEHHRPPTATPPPVWTPGRRRLTAYTLCWHWDQIPPGSHPTSCAPNLDPRPALPPSRTLRACRRRCKRLRSTCGSHRRAAASAPTPPALLVSGSCALTGTDGVWSARPLRRAWPTS